MIRTDFSHARSINIMSSRNYILHPVPYPFYFLLLSYRFAPFSFIYLFPSLSFCSTIYTVPAGAVTLPHFGRTSPKHHRLRQLARGTRCPEGPGTSRLESLDCYTLQRDRVPSLPTRPLDKGKNATAAVSKRWLEPIWHTR